MWQIHLPIVKHTQIYHHVQLQKFARTPYMASFRAGWFDFRLCTVHIYYGSEKNSKGVVQRRLDEIRTLSDFLLKRQEKDDISYILLGDFNIPDVGGDYFNALIKF